MDLDKNLQQLNKTIMQNTDYKAIEDADTSLEQQLANPSTDMYQDAVTARRTAQKASYATGTNPRVMVYAAAILERLAKAYDKAKDDSEVLKKRGDLTRAKYVEEQYQEDFFLPAIDALVSVGSPDEIINNSKIVEKLDKYADLKRTNSSGYTVAFIKSLYGGERGNFEGVSDGEVEMNLRRIKELVASDNIRAAVGVANKIKNKIDNGQNIASSDDYELIQNVVLRSNNKN